MGAVGGRVEEQIGQGIARQVQRVGDLWREDQAAALDAVGLRIGGEVFIDVGFRRQQPQHAGGRAPEDLEPSIEMEVGELLRAVETAEDEGVLRQSDRGPRRAFGHDPFAVVRLVAGKAQHLLRVINLRLFWDYPVIGDDILMIGAAHGSRESEPVHLDRRWPAGEDGGAGMPGEAVDVHQDVDAIGGDLARRGRVVHGGDIDPMLHRRLDPLGDRALRVLAAVVGEDFDLALVVDLEQFGHQIADRVLAQVRGDVAHANSPRRDVGGRIAAIGIRRVEAFVNGNLDVVLRPRQRQ